MRGSQRTQTGDLGLLLGVFFVVAVLYASLIAEVPVDDEAAFVARVTSPTVRFDVAYPLLLPFLRLAIDVVGSVMAPLSVLKAINIAAAATGFAIFALTIRQCGLTVLVSCCTVLFAALSFNFISLAPTGHPKMLSFPFLCGALHFAVQWEQCREIKPLRTLAASAICLGLSSLFLVNGLAVVPFGMVAICVLRRMQHQIPFVGAVKEAFLWSILAISTFAGGVLIAAVLQGMNAESFLELFESKNATGGVSENPVVMLARAAFALVFGFVGLQGLGSTMRAVMAGYVSNPGAVIWDVLPSLVAFVAIGLFLGWVYLYSVLTLTFKKHAPPIIFPLAFVSGFVAFGIYWQLNEAEFWYQIIVPTCLIAVLVLKRPRTPWILGFCMAALALYNLLSFAIPRQNYPLSVYKESAAQKFGVNDLVLYFSAYPGRPTFSFVAGSVEGKVSVDALFFKSKDMDEFLGQLRLSIDKSLAAGGKVYAFEIFEERNWDAPWLALANKGFERKEFTTSMQGAYCIRRLADEYRLPVWSIKSHLNCDS